MSELLTLWGPELRWETYLSLFGFGDLGFSRSQKEISRIGFLESAEVPFILLIAKLVSMVLVFPSMPSSCMRAESPNAVLCLQRINPTF